MAKCPQGPRPLHLVNQVTAKKQPEEDVKKKPLWVYQKGFFILNILRILTIITLIALVVTDTILTVTTSQNVSMFYLNAMQHMFCLAVTVFVLLAEVGFMRLSKLEDYYDQNWPLLGPHAGLITCGLIIIFLGLVMLGNSDNALYRNEENCHMPATRILIVVSGLAAVVLGILNSVANFIFRDKHRKIFSREIRATRVYKPRQSDVEDVGSLRSGSMSERSITSSHTYDSDATVCGESELNGKPKLSNLQKPQHARVAKERGHGFVHSVPSSEK